VAEPDLPGKLVRLSRRLDEASIPHAFGGAIALAAYAEPRGTDHIDVGVFVGSKDAGRVVAALDDIGVDIGVDTGVDIDEIKSGDWGRLYWGTTPIDVFFAYSTIDFESAARRPGFSSYGSATPTCRCSAQRISSPTRSSRPGDLPSRPPPDRWTRQLTPAARRGPSHDASENLAGDVAA